MQTKDPSSSAPSIESLQAANAVPPQMVLMQMATAYWVSQSIYAAAKLGIADQLKAGPKHWDQLAAATGSNSSALYRLLRALASVGVFAEIEPGRFSLTPWETTCEVICPVPFAMPLS